MCIRDSSCITETSDAQIGLLYEDEDEQLEFDKIAIDDIVNGAATGGVWVENDNGAVAVSYTHLMPMKRRGLNQK